MKRLFSVFVVILVSRPALALYCSYNSAGLKQVCTSDYQACLSQSKRMGIRNELELCRKETQGSQAKSVDPNNAKPGTCLWMEQNKKWSNLGCMESKAQCKYAENHYRSKAKVECR